MVYTTMHCSPRWHFASFFNSTWCIVINVLELSHPNLLYYAAMCSHIRETLKEERERESWCRMFVKAYMMKSIHCIICRLLSLWLCRKYQSPKSKTDCLNRFVIFNVVINWYLPIRSPDDCAKFSQCEIAIKRCEG